MGGGLQEPEAPEVMFEVTLQPGTWGCSIQRSLSSGWEVGRLSMGLLGWWESSLGSVPGSAPLVSSCSLLCPLPLPSLKQLFLQLLWAGLELDITGQLKIRDEELASTRPGRRLRLLLQQLVPRDLEGAEQRLQQFQDLREGPPLSPADLQQLLLTGLSCIYWLHAASEAEERGRWVHVFTLLTQEVLWDLCKGFCPQGQPPSLGP